MQNEKDNHIFCYRLPFDRMQAMISFTWFAIWNGDLYQQTIDLPLLGDGEFIKNKTLTILAEMGAQIDKTYHDEIEVKQPEKGEFTTTISEVATAVSKQGGFVANRTNELMHSFIHNEQAPLSLRNALKEHFQATL